MVEIARDVRSASSVSTEHTWHCSLLSGPQMANERSLEALSLPNVLSGKNSPATCVVPQLPTQTQLSTQYSLPFSKPSSTQAFIITSHSSWHLISVPQSPRWSGQSPFYTTSLEGRSPHQVPTVPRATRAVPPSLPGEPWSGQRLPARSPWP